MSIISHLLETKDKLGEIKKLWDSNNIEAIPPLIYLAISGDDEVKLAATSLLYKISSTMQQVPTSAQVLPYPIAQSQDLSKRQIVKQPKSLAVPSKSIIHSFHAFVNASPSLSKDYLEDFLLLLEKILEVKNYHFPPRFFLDVLLFLPLYFETAKANDAKAIIKKIIEISEEVEMMDVIVAANSLLELF